jgi:hypothetical protein
LFLAGCASTQTMANKIAGYYGGQHIDRFFTNYGPPVSQYTLSNRDKFYTERSDVGGG